MMHEKNEQLKKQIYQLYSEEDDIRIELCEQLLESAQKTKDETSVVYALLFLANAYLDKNDKVAGMEQLRKAKVYVNDNKPNELLEKYYTTQYRVYDSLFDTKTAFYYCLQSLKVSEKLRDLNTPSDVFSQCFVNDLENRIVGNYGNIGINFFNYGLYENALIYGKKALQLLSELEVINYEAKCLLLLNIVLSSLKLNSEENVLAYIEELEGLPLAQEELKIYCDYAYLNYYLFKKDDQMIVSYIDALFQDDMERVAGRLTAIGFYSDILETLIKQKYQVIAKRIIKIVETLIEADEVQPLLKLNQLKILYATTFGYEKEVQQHYIQYHKLYLQNEKMTQALKVNGLLTRLRMNDITLKTSESMGQIKELEEMIHYDELTKIYNRRFLSITYNKLFNEAATRMLGIAIIDVDFFKQYNDCYGHLAGDEVLKKVADCLQSSHLEEMIVCRYGGDEFVVLCWDDSCANFASYLEEVSNKVRQLNIPHETSKSASYVSLSIGFKIQQLSEQSQVLNLFNEADKALYAAKEKGRNQISEIGS